MKLVDKVNICEVGLRDGLQNESVIFTTDQKVDILNKIVDAGVKVIEVGSFVSPKAVPQMANTDDVFRAIKQVQGVQYRALIANEKGVDRAIACGCNKVKLNVSASKAHNLANLNMTPKESVEGFENCVLKAKENNIEISGSISMPFGSPWDREIYVENVDEIVKAYLDVGITEISLSDAAGMAYPTQVMKIATFMKEKYPHINWWLHFHNTRGLGVTNIVAGMQAGIVNFDTSFAAVGGCPFVPGAAGNVATEDVVHMCNEMGVKTGIDIDKIIEVSRKVVELVGHQTDSYILRAGKSGDLIKDLPTGQIKNQTQK